MPLQTGSSQKTISKNIAELMNAGYGQKQAAAIAYSKSRDESQTARKKDLNGWYEIKDNPITKVGVFPYLGSQIHESLDPNKIYMVYRPESELNNQETIDSFKLIPWVDEHAMLGSSSDGLMPAEKKGIHGTIGQDVYFDGEYLRANIKVFSEKLANLIDSGKKELSIGYRCLYELASGVYNGQQYDAIQKEIRGNHLATVEEGRAGPDVAVLDHLKFTFDAKELKAMADQETMVAANTVDEGEEVTLSSLYSLMQEMKAAIQSLVGMEKAEAAGDEDLMSCDEDEEKKDEEKMTEDEDKDDDKKDMGAMDSKIAALTREIQELKKSGLKNVIREVSASKDLANRLSQHVGTFDHSDMTVRDVAKYGVKQLRIKCQPGHEVSALEGYLAAKRPAMVVNSGMDSKAKSSSISAFLTANGGK